MLNKVILVGRLTRDPDFRQTQNGTAICRFAVAVDRNYKNSQTGEREADFINVIAWRAQAEFVSRWFHKGSMIIVEGSLQNDNYTDSNGTKHYAMQVVADNISFGESKSASQSSGYGYQQQPQQQYNSTSEPQSTQDTSSYGNLGDFEEIVSDADIPF